MLLNKLHLHVNYIQVTISVGVSASSEQAQTHDVCSPIINQDPRNFYFLFELNLVITNTVNT